MDGLKRVACRLVNVRYLHAKAGRVIGRLYEDVSQSIRLALLFLGKCKLCNCGVFCTVVGSGSVSNFEARLVATRHPALERKN